MNIAIFYIKQATHEPSPTKKRQMFCDAIHYLKKEKPTTETLFLLAHCYRHVGKYGKMAKLLDGKTNRQYDIDIIYQNSVEATCKNILWFHCYLGNRFSTKALSHLNSCKRDEPRFLSAINFAWATFHEYNSNMEFMLSFCISALKNIHLQKGHEDSTLFYVYAIDEQELLCKIINACPDVRERIKLYYKNGCKNIPACDVVVHEHLNKNAIVTECRECGEQKSCTAYGYKYYCCVTCKTNLQNGLDVEECYKKCMELHPELEYPTCQQIATHFAKNDRRIIDYEIIYAGLRKNKKLIYQIKSFGGTWQTFEEYEHECFRHMICQMFCFIGYYYDDKIVDDKMVFSSAFDVQALEISTKYGITVKNVATIIRIRKNNKECQYAIDNYLWAIEHEYFGISSYIPYQIAYCYDDLGNEENAQKYLKIAFMRNGYDVNPSIIRHITGKLTKSMLTNDETDNILLQYFDLGKITWIPEIKKVFQYHYRMWQVMERSTNRHPVIKRELENLKRIELLKTNECIVCFEECEYAKMLPLNCGHWYCRKCVGKMNGKCAYRCETNTTKK